MFGIGPISVVKTWFCLYFQGSCWKLWPWIISWLSDCILKIPFSVVSSFLFQEFFHFFIFLFWSFLVIIFFWRWCRTCYRTCYCDFDRAEKRKGIYFLSYLLFSFRVALLEAQKPFLHWNLMLHIEFERSIVTTKLYCTIFLLRSYIVCDSIILKNYN